MERHITRMTAGPRMTTKRQGRKNTIIGTVELRGQRGRFFLRFHHPHFAVFLGGDTERLSERRAVLLGLIERR